MAKKTSRKPSAKTSKKAKKNLQTMPAGSSVKTEIKSAEIQQPVVGKSVKSEKKPVLGQNQPGKSKKPKAGASKSADKVTIQTPEIVQNLSKPENLQKLIAAGVGVLVIGVTVWFSFYFVPSLMTVRDPDRAEQARKESAEAEQRAVQEREARLAAENQVLKFENQRVVLRTSQGDINLALRLDAAPQTVESFIRLVYRDYYNGTKFHRMVEGENFSVLQGGKPSENDQGMSAFDSTLPDELWEVKPEFATEGDQVGQLSNEPQFRDPSLYANFDKQTGEVTYRKGLIVMAKTQAPDSAGSQFFITLSDTILPAEYTVFGVVEESSFAVLDSILANVDPVDAQTGEDLTGPLKDGVPKPEITLEEAEIL